MEQYPLTPSVHRQTYIDLVHWHLSEFGSKRELAARLGVDPGFLSGLLASPYSTGRKRLPSRKMAERLAQLLCQDAEQREVLLFHLLSARRPIVPGPPGSPLIEPYELAYEQANAVFVRFEQEIYWSNKGNTKEAIAYVMDRGRQLARQLSPSAHAHPYIQLLLALGDTAGVIGRPDLSLHYARTARAVLQSAQRPLGVGITPAEWQEHCAWYALRILRLEAPALVALCRPKQATELAISALGTELARRNSWYWLPRLALNVILASQRMPRFPLSWLEDLHEDGVNAASTWPDKYSHLLLDSALIDAYVRQGSERSMREAEVLVSDVLKAATGSPNMSTAHQLKVHIAAARFYDHGDDRPSCEEQLRITIPIARSLAPSVESDLRRQFSIRYRHLFE